MRQSALHLFLSLTCGTLVSAADLRAQQALDQQVTVRFDNTPLATALKQLGDQAHIRFVYSESVLRQGQALNGTYQTTLGTVLGQILAPAAIGYEVVDNTYIVLRASANPAAASAPAKPASRAHPPEDFVQMGKVLDQQQKPLPGVTVQLKGYPNATATNAEGNFVLRALKADAVLVFRFIGYKTVEVAATPGRDLTVQLEADPADLDEVTVIGYGTTTRRTATGSTARISAQEIQNQPITNVLQALQGRLTGVSITQANGLPGSAISVQVRGANSMRTTPGANEPLYIVDGVPYLSTAINRQASLSSLIDGANGSTSPLNSINPNDIESIDVLKDADATSIYGSRGANGVVLITTKKGRAGKTSFQVDAKTGASVVSSFVPTLSTADYLNIRRTAFRNAGTTPTATTAPDLTVWDQNAYTDFQKLLIGNTARFTDVSGAVSGGDARTTFRVSGTYHREGNVYIGDQKYTRAAGNLNLTHRSANERFELGVSAIYGADNNNVSVQDLTGIAYALPPNFPLYRPDGSLYWAGFFGPPANPLGILNRVITNKSTNLVFNNTLRYTILPGLDFRTSAGFSRTDMDQKSLAPRSSQDPGIASAVANSSFSYNISENYILEPQLALTKRVGIGNLNALVGGTWQSQDSRQPYFIAASDFPSDAFLENVTSARNIRTETNSSQYRYASVFGRLNYNIAGKYIVNVNFRRDGSSRFGPNNRYGNFGSAGAAWVFTEEKGFGLPEWLSFGKLRGSYGRVGSDNIGNYGYLDSYASTNYVYNGLPGLYPSRIANPNYQWEETEKLESALDLSFFKDRLSLSVAYYRNRTGNQLINLILSPQTGFTGYQANLPAKVQNSGWEATLNSINLKSKSFSWTSNFNISANSNQLLEFPNIEQTTYYAQYQVGRPINSYYLYQSNGFSPDTGLPIFQELNGNTTISAGFAETGRGDRRYVVPRVPRFFGGLGNTFTYKGLSLDFLFQFVKQQGLAPLASTFAPPGYSYGNASSSAVLGYLNSSLPNWPVVNTNFTPAYSAYLNYITSDAVLQDASFIRLKNVSLGYQLPGTWLRTVKLQALRVYVQGQNLFTLTKYDGFDPESQGLALPPLRTVTGGIQCTF